jgi:two-component system, NarL family, sensor histidine kinase UhpB
MSHPLRALIIEDSEDDARLLIRELRKNGYDIDFRRVEKAPSMKEALEREKWDIIISDYVLPQFSGLAALEMLKKAGLDLPFIIVSGKIADDIAVSMMKAGAHDYNMKDNLKRLAPAVERELREAAVRRERRHAQDALEISHRLLQMANRCVAVDPLLNEIIGEIQNDTGCAAVGIRLLDENGNIPYQGYTGFSDEFYRLESPLSVKSDRCMCINVIRGATDPNLPFYTDGGSFYRNAPPPLLATVSEQEKGQTRNACKRFGYESVALIPIPVEGRIIGVIHLADPRENLVPLRTVQVMESVALQIGTAIQRIKAEDALQQSAQKLKHLSSQLLTAQEQERKRIANDLHDGLAADLAAMKFRLEKKVNFMKGNSPISREGLEEIIGNLERTIDETRRIMNNLRPSILDDLGLLPTITWLCREYEKAYTHIHVQYEIELRENEIPDALKITIFRVLQESMNNFAKHGKGDAFFLSLKNSGSTLKFTVRDNGKGFDPDNCSRGLGLNSMRERVELSGGNFEISSAIGAGTILRATWPS